MKHSIFVKLLAVLLCAASLMGVVGGTAGALVLVEGDLYNKTVDEVITQRVQNLAADSAYQIASDTPIRFWADVRKKFPVPSVMIYFPGTSAPTAMPSWTAKAMCWKA